MRRLRGEERGFTLVELLIAILILSIASVAGYRSMTQSQSVMVGMPVRVLALHVAQNELQQMRLVRLGGDASEAGSVEMGGMSFDITRRTEATRGGLRKVTVRAVGPDGTGVVAVGYLPVPGA